LYFHVFWYRGELSYLMGVSSPLLASQGSFLPCILRKLPSLLLKEASHCIILAWGELSYWRGVSNPPLASQGSFLSLASQGSYLPLLLKEASHVLGYKQKHV